MDKKYIKIHHYLEKIKNDKKNLIKLLNIKYEL